MTGLSLADTDITLETREGECLSATLLRAGYMMKLGCKRGGCGICLVHIDSGEIEYSALVAETVLTPEDRNLGMTLACRAVPTTDVTISVPEEGRLRLIAPMLVQYATRKRARAGAPMMERGATE